MSVCNQCGYYGATRIWACTTGWRLALYLCSPNPQTLGSVGGCASCYFACSPEEFCEYFFRVCLGILHWEMAGISGDFFWSPSPTKRSTKSPRKIQGKFGAKFGAKFGTKIRKNFGELSFCNFPDLASCEVQRHRAEDRIAFLSPLLAVRPLQNLQLFTPDGPINPPKIKESQPLNTSKSLKKTLWKPFLSETLSEADFPLRGSWSCWLTKNYSDAFIFEKLRVSRVIPWKSLSFQEILRVQQSSKNYSQGIIFVIISFQRLMAFELKM